MKKFFAISLIVIISMFTLTACNSKMSQHTLSKQMGIDVSGGKEVSVVDTYSGGEGTLCITISFDDDSVLKQIKSNTEWKAFPLDETVKTLVYGIEDETKKEGPFLSDGDGNPLMPEIQNGYYRLIDRHYDTKTDILNRASFNFTVGLYDTDNNTLYLCKLDT